jgi:O-antigen ligase
MKSLIEFFSYYKPAPEQKRFSFIFELIISLLFFPLFSMTLIVNVIYPFNKINIVLFALQSVLIAFWLIFTRKKILVDWFFVFLVTMNFLMFTNSAANGILYIDKTFIELSATIFLFSQFWSSRILRKRGIDALVFSAVLFAIVFTVVYRKEIFTLQVDRIGSFFGDVNYVGSIFGYCAIFILFGSLRKKAYPFLILYFYLLFIVFSTGSRSALLSSLVGGYVLMCRQFTAKHWKAIFIFTLVTITFAVVLLFIPAFSSFRERVVASLLGVFNSSDADSSMTSRLTYVSEGIELILRRPIFGYGGDGNFKYYCFDNNYSHNTLIELGVNFGLPVMVIFEGFLLYLIVKTFVKKTNGQLLVFNSVLLAVFIFQFFLPLYDSKFEFLLLGLSASAVDENVPIQRVFKVKRFLPQLQVIQFANLPQEGNGHE